MKLFRVAAIAALAVAAGTIPTAGAAQRGTLKVKVTYAGQRSDAFDLICISRVGSDRAPTCDVANRHHVSTLRAAPGRYLVIEEHDNGSDRCYAPAKGHCRVVRLRAGAHQRVHWNTDRQTAKANA